MTREEAIEVYNGLINTKIKEAFDFFAPELRESEDERIRKEMISFLRSPFIKENLTDEKVTPWLSYLEKQKEQKPAEWSGEDDQLIGFIFDLLNDLVWRKDWAMSKKECLERIKSLRPSLKPSKEQLEALGIAMDRNDSIGYNLRQLYEQLKKLM